MFSSWNFCQLENGHLYPTATVIVYDIFQTHVYSY